MLGSALQARGLTRSERCGSAPKVELSRDQTTAAIDREWRKFSMKVVMAGRCFVQFVSARSRRRGGRAARRARM
jgi:hypothetical protein